MDARVQAAVAPRHWPRWPAFVCLTAGLFTLFTIAACRRVHAIDTAPSRSESGGTIRGTVRGPGGTSPVEGRTVQVIDVATGEQHEVVTNSAGSFSFKLKPGTYRVELALRAGESLLDRPGIINLNRSNAPADADFRLDTVRISRPRAPAYRTDDGLGSPIA